jgi:hypothetical protein
MVAIIIIFVMQVFSLGTSYPAYTELFIINNSTRPLKIIIFDRSAETNEFELDVGQHQKIIYSANNVPRSPSDNIWKMGVYDNNKLIKMYRQIMYRFIEGKGMTIVEDEELIEGEYVTIDENFFQYTNEEMEKTLKLKKERRTNYYMWEINDEIFE